jgi:crotonobetainyl-CoA:carnitine CoA-transferase CaiB-like acyl-CoA transferase
MTALAGMRVIDVSRVLAGPSCAQMFADMGADVIKVEDITGDENRRWLPIVDGRSGNFMSVNRGKRGITLNLKSPRGQEVLARLVKRADVLIENFPPETARRLGLSWENLSSINDRLVHVSITGYGSRGPLKDRPGYDNMVQAFSGMMAMTGEADRGPARLGPSVIDMGTGAFAFAGACAALVAREQGKAKGQHVEVSLLQTGLAQLGYHFTAYTLAGMVPQRTGSAVWHMVPYQAFRTADGYVLAGATNDAAWVRMAEALGVPELGTDPRYAGAQGRSERREELIALLEPLYLQHTTDEWVAILDAAKIPCSPVQDVAQALAHPQVAALGMIHEVPDGRGGTLRLCGVPVEMSATPPRPGGRPPDLGEHTESVLRDDLGYGMDDISALRAEGAI